MGLWNRYTHAHIARHRFVCVCVCVCLVVFKTGDKITKQNFPMNTSLIFKDRERQSEKGASLILLPFPPHSPDSKHSFWGWSRGGKGQENGALSIYWLCKELLWGSSCSSCSLGSFACSGCGGGGWDTGRQGVWGVTSNIFCTSRKMGFVS